MDILFITVSYNNLYKPIETELISQGHNVTTIIDEGVYSIVWSKSKLDFRFRFEQWRIKKFNLLEKYWKKRLSSDPRFNKRYDLLFMIQGLSFSPLLLNHLRDFNTHIKSSLYIWDSNKSIDFFHNAPYFDNVFTFDYHDYLDAKSDKIKFLPFYWPLSILNYENNENRVDISSMGSNHDGRLKIFETVIRQCEKMNKSYDMKLYVRAQDKFTYLDYLRIFYYRLKGIDEQKLEHFYLSRKKKSYRFITYDIMSSEDLIKMMAHSRSILDTDRELQGGTTPRLIWALALNKHIYTTNANIKKLPFYDSRYIHIIDRNNPIVDFSLMDDIDFNSRDSVEFLRIDNWVKMFL